MKSATRYLSAALCAASIAVLALPADARPRKRYIERDSDVIVVRPRAFTDSGVVVPVGSRNNYVLQNTYYFKQPYEAYSPGILWRPDPGFR